MKKKYRKFSPEEKVRILRRHLLEKVSVSDVCDEYDLNTYVVSTVCVVEFYLRAIPDSVVPVLIDNTAGSNVNR